MNNSLVNFIGFGDLYDKHCFMERTQSKKWEYTEVLAISLSKSLTGKTFEISGAPNFQIHELPCIYDASQLWPYSLLLLLYHTKSTQKTQNTKNSVTNPRTTSPRLWHHICMAPKSTTRLWTIKCCSRLAGDVSLFLYNELNFMFSNRSTENRKKMLLIIYFTLCCIRYFHVVTLIFFQCNSCVPKEKAL